MYYYDRIIFVFQTLIHLKFLNIHKFKFCEAKLSSLLCFKYNIASRDKFRWKRHDDVF